MVEVKRDPRLGVILVRFRGKKSHRAIRPRDPAPFSRRPQGDWRTFYEIFRFGALAGPLLAACSSQAC
jgi:hypothetical protein